jgi:hypothetical protein
VELVRVSRDVYGQEVLEGASWDLLPVFAGVALAIVVAHAVYMAVLSLARRARGARAHPS